MVNFDLGDGFRDLGLNNGGDLAPHARRVAVLGVGAGGSHPLPLRGSGVSPPEIFLRFLMPNPAFGGNLGQKIN